jgi:hypothetical protein
MPYISNVAVFRGRGNLTGKSMDIARAVLLEPSVSYQDVANRFGVSRQRVGAIVKRMGIQRRVGNEVSEKS